MSKHSLLFIGGLLIICVGVVGINYNLQNDTSYSSSALQTVSENVKPQNIIPTPTVPNQGNIPQTVVEPTNTCSPNTCGTNTARGYHYERAGIFGLRQRIVYDD